MLAPFPFHFIWATSVGDGASHIQGGSSFLS